MSILAIGVCSAGASFSRRKAQACQGQKYFFPLQSFPGRADHPGAGKHCPSQKFHRRALRHIEFCHRRNLPRLACRGQIGLRANSQPSFPISLSKSTAWPGVVCYAHLPECMKSRLQITSRKRCPPLVPKLRARGERSVVCGDCSAVICRICGTHFESADD